MKITTCELGGVIHTAGGGSGGAWSRNSLRKASLRDIRHNVEKLLSEQKLPLHMMPGHVDITGDAGLIVGGIAGAYSIFWRKATKQEMSEFDYDTWLVDEFPRG